MSWRYGALFLAAVLVSSCGVVGHPAQGTVHGTFERAGGPAIVKHGKATTPVVPLAGTVTFTNGSVSKVSISIGSSGTFSAHLPPGTYAVSGVSGGQACSVPLTARVRAGETSRILVLCVAS
jgi:hypothetical protein